MMRVDKQAHLSSMHVRERERESFRKFQFQLNIIDSRTHNDVLIYIFVFSFRFMQGTFCSEKNTSEFSFQYFPFFATLNPK